MLRSLRACAVALFCALLASPAAAGAAEIPLPAISAYLNALDTAKATFAQKNSDGTVSNGELFIHRPYRMRFQYDPPNKALVIAGAGSVAVFDPKSNQPPEQYPLGRTPLALILAPRIDLGEAKMVVSHRETQGGLTEVVAQDPAHPDDGQIALYFAADPITLKGWIITDASGGRTEVQLSALKTGMTLPDSLFDIRAETQKRLGR